MGEPAAKLLNTAKLYGRGPWVANGQGEAAALIFALASRLSAVLELAEELKRENGALNAEGYSKWTLGEEWVRSDAANRLLAKLNGE